MSSKEDLKTFRFCFKATLGDFSLNAPNITCPLLASWKRSSQATSSQPTEMKGGKACFNETLSLPLNMYYDQAKQAFQDKKTLFVFTMSTPKGDKQAGVVYVEVAQLLNNKMDQLEGTFTLEKCPVKDSKVAITIVAELIGQGSTSDTMSVDSTLFNQGDGPSSLSTISIQSKKDVSEPSSPIKPKKKPEQKIEEKSQSKQPSPPSTRQSQLQQQVRELSLQKQKLLGELQKSRSRDDNRQLSELRQQLVRGKGIQEKLQRQMEGLRSENASHQRQLQKMRVRMQQIYDLLLGNLNSLY